MSGCTGRRRTAVVRRGGLAVSAGSTVDMRPGAVVVIQEDLFQCRLTADKRLDRMTGERSDHRADASRDLEAEGVRSRGDHVHAGESRERRRSAGKRHLDAFCAQVTQLLQPPLVDESAATQDPDPLANGLDLAEDMRGEDRKSTRL